MLKKNTEISNWINSRIKTDQIEKYLNRGKCFIDEGEIADALEAKASDSVVIEDILQKSLSIKALTLQETAILLNVEDKDILRRMGEVAGQVKRKVYDNRIVTFAPLYMSNLCVNNCLYCGFREDNSDIQRRTLSLDEVKRETEVLAGQIGHKRLVVVYGEHPQSDIEYMRATIKEIYKVRAKTKKGYGQIRRVNVNAAPLSIEDLKVLQNSGIGTYQVFQETYHPKTYQTVHPKGSLKSNYLWRLYCMHRAFEAGIDDVGIGVLFGLYNWKFEVLSLISHSRELESKFGVGPHTISFPRLEPAANTPFNQESNYQVSDQDFKKLITVIRLAVPHTGMIITARENAQIRREAIPLGCTQTDASTRIGIGAYSDRYAAQEGQRQQFFLGDTRSLDEVIRELSDAGYITSFCTAGYRCGRTGKCIMELLKNGEEGKLCKLNAVLTFREWLDDFATDETKIAGEKIIQKELAEIKLSMPTIYPKVMEHYRSIEQGKRDIYF